MFTSIVQPADPTSSQDMPSSFQEQDTVYFGTLGSTRLIGPHFRKGTAPQLNPVAENHNLSSFSRVRGAWKPVCPTFSDASILARQSWEPPSSVTPIPFCPNPILPLLAGIYVSWSVESEVYDNFRLQVLVLVILVALVSNPRFCVVSWSRIV